MTEPKRRGRPPAPEGRKPILPVRVAASIQKEAKEIAERRGETMGEVVEAALKRYIGRHRAATKTKSESALDHHPDPPVS